MADYRVSRPVPLRDDVRGAGMLPGCQTLPSEVCRMSAVLVCGINGPWRTCQPSLPLRDDVGKVIPQLARGPTPARATKRWQARLPDLVEAVASNGCPGIIHTVNCGPQPCAVCIRRLRRSRTNLGLRSMLTSGPVSDLFREAGHCAPVTGFPASASIRRAAPEL